MLTLLASSALLLAPFAGTLHVDQGSAHCATADGSFALPFCTILEAVTAASDGDTIRVGPGVYSEELRLFKDLVIEGVMGAEATVLDAQGLHLHVLVGPVSTVTLVGLTMRNGSGSNAGAVHNRGRVRIRECVISDNFGIDGSGLDLVSGGVFSSGIEVTIEDSYLLRNRAHRFSYDAGTAVMAFPGSEIGAFVDIRNCTIAGGTWSNLPMTAVYAGGASLSITNTTITGNSGGGVYFPAFGGGQIQETCRIQHCTITDNHGSYSSGVRGLPNGNPQSLVIQESVVAGNTATQVAGDLAGAIASGGHNLVGVQGPTAGWSAMPGDQIGTAAAPLSAQLGPLEQAGGLTPTHGLQPSSTARDAGPSTPSSLFDQRGVQRPVGAVDIGAREMSQGSTASICMALSNSTGRTGKVVVSSDGMLSSNAVDLTAMDLPSRVTAIFVAARIVTAGTQPAGSGGGLCLGSDLGLLNRGGRVMQSDGLGRVSLRLDLGSLPSAFGTVAALPGEPWYFQAWHRDLSSSGITSSFTEAVEATWN